MGRGRRDQIYLTGEQRENLETISRNGHGPAKKILHARILLMCDEGQQATRKWTDEQIAEALGVHRNTALADAKDSSTMVFNLLSIGNREKLHRFHPKSMEQLRHKSLPCVVLTHRLVEQVGR